MSKNFPPYAPLPMQRYRTAVADSLDMSMVKARFYGSSGGILGAVILMFLVIFFGSIFLVKPTFRASAELFVAAPIDPPQDQVGTFIAAPADETVLNTEVQVLHSHDLIAQLIETLDLSDDPEFDARPVLALGHVAMPWVTPEQFGEMLRFQAVNDAIDIVAIPRSAVLRISVTTSDPAKSARMANQLTQLYLANRHAWQQGQRDQAVGWLAGRVTQLRAELVEKERAVTEFRARIPAIAPQTLVQYETRLLDLQDRIDRLQPSLAMAHPPVETQRQHEQLIAAYNDLSAVIAQRGRDLIQLRQMQEEANATHILHDHYVMQLKTISAAAGQLSPGSRILSAATIPTFPHQPRSLLLALTAAMITGLIGLALVLWKEIRNSRFRTERELAQYSGYPVLGHSPRHKSASHVLSDQMINAMRGLRCAILSARIQPSKVIMISSADPDGITNNIATALTQSLSDIGKRVLLITADRCVLTSGTPALDRVDADFTISPDPALRADVICIDEDMLNVNIEHISMRLGALLADQNLNYDNVIFNVPPLSACPEARLLAEHADGVILSVIWNSTESQLLDATLSALETSGIPIIGLMLTDVSGKGQRRYRLIPQTGFHMGNRAA